MTLITKSVVFSLLTLLTVSAVAQTPQQREQIKSNYDLNMLAQLEAESLEDFERKRAEALALAALNGWPETYEFEDGGVGVLIEVIDGQPIYLETMNKNGGITIRADRVHTGGSAGLDLN